MRIELDDLTRPQVHALLQEHLTNMYELSPPENVFALDLGKLRVPEISFWSVWEGDALLGCGALKELSPTEGEIKSMRTPAAARRRGAGRAVLEHILTVARQRGYRTLSLETGSHPAFVPAQTLYRSLGFELCGPFGDYPDDPHSVFMTLDLDNHNATVVDQFTRQADAFAAAAPIRDQQALDLLVSACAAGPTDESLDVACGPGLVACAFARVVRAAVGIDLTAAMIRKAEALAACGGLSNVSFQVGDVNALPYPDGRFSIVTSRYAFHHFEQPGHVLREMVRVCKPGGRIAVMDMVASDEPATAARFHRMEKLRDPSHAAALTLEGLRHGFLEAGLAEPAISHHRMPMELEGLLDTSFPNDGDREKVREMILSSLDDDSLGVRTRVKDGKVRFSYPIALLVSTVR